jgi:phage/plasmid-like protein (TIGR03299 family)
MARGFGDARTSWPLAAVYPAPIHQLASRWRALIRSTLGKQETIMSNETAEWLNNNTLIGFTDKRGTAWHYRADLQSAEPNHYPGAIPVDDVKRRLFDWEAVSVPLGANLSGVLGTDRDAWRTYDSHQAIVHSRTCHLFGVFKDGYQPHQPPQWLIDKVAVILDDDLSIGSAGLLRQCAQAWVSIELPDTITTAEGVAFRPNLLAYTSFDGSLATTYKRVVQLVVCDNTFAVARHERSNTVKVKHTRYGKLDVMAARDALGIVHDIADDFAAEVTALTQTTVDTRTWQAFLDITVPVPEDKGRARTMAETKRAELHRLWTHDARVAPWTGTAFGVHQAVNTYVHHVQTVRNAIRAERNMDRVLSSDLDKLATDTTAALNRALVTVGADAA